jgi:hypothetical protein
MHEGIISYYTTYIHLLVLVLVLVQCMPTTNKIYINCSQKKYIYI